MARITTYDIAQACGVSQATVDRALNNRSNIKKETRDLIVRTAVEMNYRPSTLPAYLKTGKTKAIGLIFPKAVPFYTELIDVFTRTIRQHDYHTMISLSQFNVEQEKEYLSEYLKANVDGILLFPTGNDGSEIKKIIQAGIPVVTLIRRISNYHFDFVSVNYARAAQKAIQHLIDLGHRRIGYFTIWDSSANMYTYNERKKGIERAMKRNGLEIRPEHVIHDTEDFQHISALIEAGNLPTAFLCFNDLSAIGLVSFLLSIGKKVPKDVSIIGFDNIDILHYFNPPMTSIAYPYEDIAEASVELLIDRIEHPSANTVSHIFEMNMVLRSSCRRIVEPAGERTGSHL